MNDNFKNPTQKRAETPQSISSPLRTKEARSESDKPLSDIREKTEPKTVAIKPGFYLVSTPIGNLRDITFRALDVLSSVDIIACEDTRVTGKLLNAYGFKKKMYVYNDHSSDTLRSKLIEMAQAGQSVALLSDAGTPLISDPGYKLVREAQEKEIYVTSIPGANAALTALQLSALPTDQFSFLGFLPPKSGARQKALKKWETTPGSLVMYETGPRLLDSLQDMRIAMGNRKVAVMRELTKMYEESVQGTLSDLILHYTQKGTPKGEIVVVLGPQIAEVISTESIENQLKAALKNMSVRDAAEMVSEATGKPKRTIYTLALKLSSDSQ